MMFDTEKELSSERLRMSRKSRPRTNDMSYFAKRFFNDLHKVRSNPTETFFLTYREGNGQFRSISMKDVDDYLDHLEEFYANRDNMRIKKLVIFELFRYLSDKEEDLLEDIYGSHIGIGRGVRGRKGFEEEDIMYMGKFEFSDEDKRYFKNFY